MEDIASQRWEVRKMKGSEVEGIQSYDGQTYDDQDGTHVLYRSSIIAECQGPEGHDLDWIN